MKRTGLSSTLKTSQLSALSANPTNTNNNSIYSKKQLNINIIRIEPHPEEERTQKNCEEPEPSFLLVGSLTLLLTLDYIKIGFLKPYV